MSNKISLGILVKLIFSTALYKIGYLQRKLKEISYRNCVILMYHRVLKETDSPDYVERGMFVTDKTFDIQLKFLKKYFNVISLDKAIRYIYFENKHTSKISSHPLCVLTFDDGWNDFINVAYPILKKYNLESTVFLPTNLIGQNKLFWTERLYLIFECLNKMNLSNIPDNDTISSIYKKERISKNPIQNMIKSLKKFSNSELNCILSKTEKLLKINDLQKDDQSFMTWEEIDQLNKSGIVQFGSHTANHCILTNATDSEIINELIISKRELIDRRLMDNHFYSFSYPNGNFNENIKNFVKNNDYHCALTTKFGFNSFSTDIFELNRISIHNDISFKEPLFAAKILGYF